MTFSFPYVRRKEIHTVRKKKWFHFYQLLPLHHGVCFISLFQLFVLFSPYSILLLVTLPENSFVTRMLFLSQRFGWGSLLLLPVPYLLRLYSLLPEESGEPREHSDCCTHVAHDLIWGPIKTFSDSYWWSGHWRCTSCSKLQILPYSVIWRFIGRVTCQDMDPLDSSPLCDSPLVWNVWVEWRHPLLQLCAAGGLLYVWIHSGSGSLGLKMLSIIPHLFVTSLLSLYVCSLAAKICSFLLPSPPLCLTEWKQIISCFRAVFGSCPWTLQNVAVIRIRYTWKMIPSIRDPL